MKVAIIGGGISGLSLGYYLSKYQIDFELFEKESFCGGKILSTPYQDFFLEKGPNTLLTTPLTEELISELTIENETLKPNLENSKNRFIIKNGNITKIPNHPLKLIFSNIISWRSKLSILKDLRFKASKTPENQTVTEFFNLHFSEEITETFVKAFCRGIYATNSDELLIKNCFPQLANYQEKYGSVIKGMIKNRSIAKRQVVSFQKGIFTLLSALEQKIQANVSKNTEVTDINSVSNNFLVQTNKSEPKEFTHVIFACDAQNIANHVKKILPKTSEALSKIKYASLSVINSVYNKNERASNMNGFGVLYPNCESDTFLGHIWNSSIFPIKSQNIIITSMIKYDPDNLSINDLNAELENKFDLSNNNLIHRQTTHWKNGIPIYNSDHKQFLNQYSLENKYKLYICSNVMNGVSIPDRIQESKTLAEKLKNER
jgi:oxygen-dependent protoporphyrinogen oxidase